MEDSDDLYEVLQVSPNADAEVIEAAYKRLATRYHPDRNRSEDATRRMVALNAAYDVLKDPRRRARYDRTRLGREQQSAEQRAANVAPDQPRVDRSHSNSRWLLWAALAGAVLVGLRVECLPDAEPEAVQPISLRVPPPPTPTVLAPIAQPKPTGTLPSLTAEQLEWLAKNRVAEKQPPRPAAAPPHPAPAGVDLTPDELSRAQDALVKSTCKYSTLNGQAAYNQCLARERSRFQHVTDAGVQLKNRADSDAISSVCSAARSSGPAALRECVARQVADLQRTPAPDLSGVAQGDQEMMASACSGSRYKGPAEYNRCLAQQAAALRQQLAGPDR